MEERIAASQTECFLHASRDPEGTRPQVFLPGVPLAVS